jgi:4-aminobutyrate aminotransferase-like enzyme/Ser/Thr protein kinase RdoA (MazF antagonist)
MQEKLYLGQEDTSSVSSLLIENYRIKGILHRLQGEVDYNFKLSTLDGSAYLVKVSQIDPDIQSIDFQLDIQRHLNVAERSFPVSQTIFNHHGEEKTVIKDKLGREQIIRVHQWLEGKPLGEANPRSVQLLQAWGSLAGEMSCLLKGYTHPAAKRAYKWDPSRCLTSKPALRLFKDPLKEKIALHYWDAFEEKVLPTLPSLRKSINHNDLHESNVLINARGSFTKITGVIDFGDAIYTETINEIAIVLAYAGMGALDPLRSMCIVLTAYHEKYAIKENELDVLYYLVAARLLITVSSAAEAKINTPDNDYLHVSEQGAWKLLEQWYAIDSNFAKYAFKTACNYDALDGEKVLQYLESKDLHPIVTTQGKRVCELDLSIGSIELGSNYHFSHISLFCDRVNKMIRDKKGSIGIGGYKEVRPFYTTDSFTVEGDFGPQWRTVHLGIDVWTEELTPLYAPLDARVHSVQDNKGDCDYGPTLILEHQTDQRHKFYTLYGHLDLDCLRWKEGDLIKAGDKIAHIGGPPINGNWPPHLHFQLILDMLGKDGDFPGVAFAHEIETWEQLCPNPAVFFKEMGVLSLNKHLDGNEVHRLREEVLGRNLSLSYQQPLYIQRGYGTYLYDDSGRRFLDTVNNVAHLGHEHYGVVKAGQRQMEILNTNTRYLHSNIVNYARALADTFPPSLCVVYFTNSGSEANELALRMAKTYTGKEGVMALDVGYHGNTNATIDVSAYKFNAKGGKGCPSTTQLLPIPDIFRSSLSNKAYLEKTTQDIEETLYNLTASPAGFAAFIGESILSCGGQILPPDGYFKEVYKQVRAVGGLCIADEVQTGFGRVGKSFWAFELHGVIPDIVSMGKPIGNGHPIGAVITTRAIADTFDNGMEFFNTYGGNPVSCAIGHQVLKTIKEEKLQEHALVMGEYLKESLRNLQSKYPIIGDVRGEGLFLGMELLTSLEDKVPAPQEAKYLINRMRSLGVLMSTDGPYHNVIKIKPPLSITKQQASFLIQTLDRVFKEDGMQV